VETAEVIVAGGGIIGLSTALELARHGFRVRVLEKGRAMSRSLLGGGGYAVTP
jgi:glycine/D-amino acid oxidase-like deaminating enzyme